MAVAIALAYAPSLGGEFVWDDAMLVEGNPLIRSPWFVFEAFRHRLFQEALSNYYRPLQTVTYIADYAVWGLWAPGFRWANVGYHALASALLAVVVRGLGVREGVGVARAGWIGVAVGLIWAIHPAHNAAVAYVAGRADPLAAVGALAAWALVLGGGGGWRWGAMAVAWALAFSAKEIAATWAAVFLVWTWGFDRATPVAARGVRTAALAVGFAVYLGLRALPEPGVEPVRGDPVPPWPERVALATRALGDYGAILAWPDVLRMERTVTEPGEGGARWVWPPVRRGERLNYVGLLAAGGLVALAFVPGRTRRLRRLGAVWFVIGFLPISNLIPLNAEVAEHWIYMASAGLLLGVAAPLLVAAPVRVAAAAVIVVVAGLGVRTWHRAAEWRSGEVLYDATLAGGESPRIALNRAATAMAGGEAEEAKARLKALLEVRPDYQNARTALGVLLLKEGRKEEARRLLVLPADQAVELKKRFTYGWRGPMQYARDLAARGEHAEGLEVVEAALAVYPDQWALARLYSGFLTELRGADAASAWLAAYCGRHWWNAEAHLQRARIELRAGREEAAERLLRRVEVLDVRGVDAPMVRATIAAEAGRWDEARAAAAKAVRRDRGNAAARKLQGEIEALAAGR